MFDTNGKNCWNVHILVTGNILTFWIAFYRHFSNLYQHFPCCKYLAVTYINTENGYEKQKCNTKRTHISATCYSWNTCSNNGFSFCFSLKTKSQTNIWLNVWKSFLLVLKQILGWAFWSSENIESFLKSGLHTRLHTSNENLDFLAELYISSFFFEIFHWT